mgnify:CR=1 FL=1
MLEWSIPEAEDEDWINSCIAVSGTMASDASFANIYLLRNKYSAKINRYKDFIRRKYSGKGARCGYTFPLGKGMSYPLSSAVFLKLSITWLK